MIIALLALCVEVKLKHYLSIDPFKCKHWKRCLQKNALVDEKHKTKNESLLFNFKHKGNMWLLEQRGRVCTH